MALRGLRAALAAALAIATACSGPPDSEPGTARPPGTIVATDTAFSRLAGAFHDPLTDLYLVLNAGVRSDTADDGFISVVSPEGEVLAARWIDGAADSVTLREPAGVAAAGDLIYVTDLTEIRRFDRETGAPRGAIPVPGATRLGGIATALDGTLYFTDTGLRRAGDTLQPAGTDAVYRIGPAGALDTLARGPELGHPIATSVSGDTAWVVSRAGRLFAVGAGWRGEPIAVNDADLAGVIAFSGDAFVVGRTGTLWRGGLGAPLREALVGLEAPAGLGHDLWRHRLLLPLADTRELLIVPLVAP